MPMLAYVSHPIGEDDEAGERAAGTKRAENIAAARDWIRFFADTTQWAIEAPWFVYVTTHGEAIYAPRRARDSLAILERSDLVVQCGGIISPHMHMEARTARRHGIPIVDLTSLGVYPPDQITDATKQAVLTRAQRAVQRRPRRVWMPLLTEDDIEKLKESRHVLHTFMTSEHNRTVSILDRIIAAASHFDVGKDPE